MRIFTPNVDLRQILHTTRERGYVFINEGIMEDIRIAMMEEVKRLTMETGDHLNHPINKGTPQEVRQQHARAYYPLDHVEVPFGTRVCKALHAHIQPFSTEHPELKDWIPNKIGYQLYRDSRDWISPHRDRKSDHLCSVTFTIRGSAWVKIYAPTTDPPDYSQLTCIDECLTTPGTVMFLRAPGFGIGTQIIHEVMPPVRESRLILNLRMRSTILKSPKETTYE